MASDFFGFVYDIMWVFIWKSFFFHLNGDAQNGTMLLQNHLTLLKARYSFFIFAKTPLTILSIKFIWRWNARFMNELNSIVFIYFDFETITYSNFVNIFYVTTFFTIFVRMSCWISRLLSEVLTNSSNFVLIIKSSQIRNHQYSHCFFKFCIVSFKFSTSGLKSWKFLLLLLNVG